MTNLRYVISVPYFVRIAPLYLASIALISVGCGRIDLGDDLGPDDASIGDPPSDSSGTGDGSGASQDPVIEDPEPVIVEPLPEGCTEFAVVAPTGWPFLQSADGYKEAAWATMNESGCNAGICHGGTQAPLMAVDEATADSNYQSEFEGLWSYFENAQTTNVVADGADLVGTIWFHHPNAGNLVIYNEASIAALNGIIDRINACNLVSNDASAKAQSDPGCDDIPPPADANCFCPLPVPANVPLNCNGAL